MNYILEFLLYRPRVYSGLDHLMVELARQATRDGNRVVCVYCDSMDGMPALQADIAEAGGIVEVIRSNKKKMLADIWHLYRKYRPQAVDTHFVQAAKIYTALLSRVLGVKHFTHEHSLLGDDVQQYIRTKGPIKRIGLGLYYWLLTRWSKRVFCISEAIHRQYLLWSYGHCRNVQTLYIGTQIVEPRYTRSEARELLHIPAEAKVLTNISAIEPIKGIDIILQTVALLKQQGQEWLFVHIGGLRSDTAEQRDYAESLCTMAEQLGIADNVRWLGRRTDVQDILPMADIYVHPSRSEGLGSVLMEAAVAHLPLIGTRVGGIPEIIHEGKTGLLVPTDDAEALAQAVMTMEKDKESVGEKAYQHVRSQFEQNTQAGVMYEMYDSTSC